MASRVRDRPGPEPTPAGRDGGGGSATAGLDGNGRVASTAEAFGRLALGVFAYLEITDGANWLRRSLGGAVAAWLVVTLGNDLR